MDALTELHRIIDARLEQKLRDAMPEWPRGTVTSVTTDLRIVSATLDGADVATPGIRYPAHAVPVVGDDIIVMRKRDGFLLVFAILGRD